MARLARVNGCRSRTGGPRLRCVPNRAPRGAGRDRCTGRGLARHGCRRTDRRVPGAVPGAAEVRGCHLVRRGRIEAGWQRADDRPPPVQGSWAQFEAYREDPEHAPAPEGYTAPFYKADREDEYRQAHAVFSAGCRRPRTRVGSRRHEADPGRRQLAANLTQYLTTTFDLVDDECPRRAGRVREPPGAGHLPGAVPADPHCRSGWPATAGAGTWSGTGRLSGAVRAPGEGVRATVHSAQPGRADAGHHRHRLGQDRVVPDPDPRPLPPGAGQGQAGVKAVLLYPMNALATDQTQRINGCWQQPGTRAR